VLRGDAPAPDYVLDCVSDDAADFGEALGVLAAATPDATPEALARATQRVDAPGASDQFLLFLPRAVLALTRTPGDFVFELAVQFFAGAFLGALYPHFEFNDCQPVAFMLQLSLGGTVMLSSARTFGATRVAAWRELSPTLAGMGLSPTASAAATCLVEVPRLLLLTAAFLSTWFPTARPRTTFAQSFGPCFCAALAASGAAHVFSVAQDAKSAQLSSVAALVIAAMFAGVEPRLSELQKLGAGAKPLIWGSYARWLVESLYAAEVSALSTAWRMPPAFYNRPRAESALMGLFMYDYVARAATINCVLLALLGLLFRLVALAALSGTNRDRMGLRSPAHVFYDAYAALAGGVGRWWRRPRKVGSTAAELPSLGGAPAGERRGLLAVATVRNGGGAVV